MNALIFDTETTGFQPPVEVIELAWISWPNTDELEFCSYYKPSKPIEFGAMATHHITADMLEEAEPATLAPTHLPQANYLIGHNVDFDWEVMGRPAGSRICTLALSRSLWPECDSHKLTALYYFLNGTSPSVKATVQGAHRALDDVLMTRNILHHIIKKLNVHDLERLYAASEDARIPKIMTFGKFKDQPISAVDRGYANWYRRQTDTDPYVIEAFRRAGLC